MADPEDGRMTGEHIDEGLVHSWLDGQLPTADAVRLESHIASCAACTAMVAEARGFVAASSRILSGLDGVPSRVVPRVHSRTRIWQVRAAAAVVVVALGAAAVLRDAGRLGPVRQAASVPQPGAAASPGSGLPDTTQVPSAAVTPVKPVTPVPSPALASSRAPIPAMQPAKKQTPAARLSAAASANALQESRAAATPSGADQAVAGAAAAVPLAVQDSSRRRPFSASRTALAAKAIPPVGQAGGLPDQTHDSSAASTLSGLLDARQIASGAYRECAGKIVILPVGDSATSPPTYVTTVRLDSASRSSPARTFVVTVPGAGVPVDGWWRPAGADSAVVSLVNRKVTSAPAVSAEPVAPDTSMPPLAKTSRVRCTSP
jgi:hypothetical protein